MHTREELTETVFSTGFNLMLYSERELENFVNHSCVEAGSNTSTIDLQVIRGNETGTQCLGITGTPCSWGI